MMPIKDLRPRQGKVDITATVVSKEEPRTWEKFGKQGKVVNATIKDETGQIKLTLWNDECDQVGEGDIIKITNGFVNEWQGEMQLSAGRFGKLEVVEKGKGAPASETNSESAEAEEDTETPEEPNDETKADEEDIL